MPMRALLLILSLSITLPALSQTKSRSSSKPANVQAGTLVSIDTAAATLILKTKAGADITYRLTEKTHVLREKKSAESDSFKPGDSIVVRFRKSSVGPASLYDLADKPSWEWLNRLRHDTTMVTIKEITDEALHATEGADPVDYRVTDKTTWAKAGKPATASDFKPGDKAYVVPRMLPSGGIMAVGVSDASGSAAILKERSRVYVTGLVKVINVEKRLLSFHSVAGDDRELSIVEDCVVRQASKDVPLNAVHPGQTVTNRLTRNDEGEQVISRITIQSKKSAPKRKPLLAKPKP